MVSGCVALLFDEARPRLLPRGKRLEDRWHSHLPEFSVIRETARESRFARD